MRPYTNVCDRIFSLPEMPIMIMTMILKEKMKIKKKMILIFILTLLYVTL